MRKSKEETKEDNILHIHEKVLKYFENEKNKRNFYENIIKSLLIDIKKIKIPYGTENSIINSINNLLREYEVTDIFLCNPESKSSRTGDTNKVTYKEYKDFYLSLIKSDNLIKLKSNDESINFIMKKYPNLKVYLYNDSSYNLLKHQNGGCFCFSNFIFIHESCKDNIGVIMHEISHAINQDSKKQTYLTFLLSFIYNKTNSKPPFSDNYWKIFSLWLKVNELRRQFNIKYEERADKFAACFGKKYANDLSNYLKQYIGTDSQISSEFQTHPKTEERIKYLNNFYN